MRKGNFDGHYTDWRKKRIQVTLDHYGEEFFTDKTLLEVGAGWGDTGKQFAKLGADVTVSDAREEHMHEARRRNPEVNPVVIDSESTTWDYDQDFDVIIHWGLLYHLQNPEEHLKLISDHCDHLIIETLVADSEDPDYIVFRNEETNWKHGAWGMAFSGVGCIPSYAFVERIFEECGWEWKRLENPGLCNSGMHHYDWPRKNKKGFKPGQRAFWFCEKKI